MKNIVKVSIKVSHGLIIALMLFAGFYTINAKNTEIANLNAENVAMSEKIDEDYTYYTETIKGIVKTVQVTDSYLFVSESTEGGLGGEEWTIKEYEEAMKNTSQTQTTEEILKNTKAFFSKRESYLNQMPNIWPIPYEDNIELKSDYAERLSPFTGLPTFHHGIDLFSRVNGKIIATADGVVKDNWLNHETYGKWVVIDHKNSLETWYAHMSKVFVHEGDIVKKGDVIGIIGSTGLSTGTHVHYAMRKAGEFVNPLDYIRRQNLTKK